MPSPKRTPPNTRPQASPSRLPPPTASERAFEHLLAHFDDLAMVSGGPSAEHSPRSRGTTQSVVAGDTDAAFLAHLFEARDEYAVRDRFATIGDANDFFTKVVGVSFEGRQDVVAGMVAGQELTLVRQPDNPVDSNAVAVF